MLIDWGVPCQKEISGLGQTNSRGHCNYYRAGIQGQVTLCEEKPDGTSDCTGTAIMTSNEGQCIILEIKNNHSYHADKPKLMG